MSKNSEIAWYAPGGAGAVVQWMIAGLVAGSSVLFIAATLLRMDRGFDFTDEAFYLMWAQDPRRYDIALGFFGYGLHPLFELVGESVAGLRQLGAAIAVAAGALTSTAMLRCAGIRFWTPTALQIVSSCALLPLSYYVFWIPTPSYNWFALISEFLLLCAIVHLLRAEYVTQSGVLAALAGLCIFFSRPQNAAAYAAVYLAATLWFARSELRIARALLVAGVCTLVLVGSFVFWAPFETLAHQIRGYFDVFGLAHPGGTSFVTQLMNFLRGPGAFFICSVALFLLVSALNSKCRLKRWMMLLPGSAAALLALTTASTITMTNFIYQVGFTAGSATYVVLSFCRFRKDVDNRLIDLLGWASLLPLAATFGSGDRTADQLGFFFGLWGMIAIIAVSHRRSRPNFRQAMMTLAWVALVLLAIHIGVSYPYRLAAPIASQTNVTLLNRRSELGLDEKTSSFIKALQKGAREHGFCQEDPMLDLGSASPGVIFALGGRASVFPWVFAGYSFSERFAKQVVDRISPADLRRTWLVVSEAPHTLSRSQIEAIGIDLSLYSLSVQLVHPVTGYPLSLFAPKDLSHC